MLEKRKTPTPRGKRLTMGIAAECGLALRHGQLLVEVSRQVLDPHRWALREEGLAAAQLLLQLCDVQLRRRGDKTGRGPPEQI